jgi:hypothetical protein
MMRVLQLLQRNGKKNSIRKEFNSFYEIYIDPTIMDYRIDSSSDEFSPKTRKSLNVNHNEIRSYG